MVHEFYLAYLPLRFLSSSVSLKCFQTRDFLDFFFVQD
uniref:Uncharacterized protein n=1 Tax=Anguilla anguilla TaxID=7936 RepID=A0A0E9TV48_ANGAN